MCDGSTERAAGICPLRRSGQVVRRLGGASIPKMPAAFSRPTARALMWFFALGCCGAASAQQTAAQRRVAAAAHLYEELEYERALDQLSKAKAGHRTIADDLAIALYEGIILADMGRPEESTAAFREALRLKPDAVLPVKVSPKVQGEFEKIRRERSEETPPPARQSATVAEDRPERPKPPPSLEPTAAPTDLHLTQTSSSGMTLKRATPYALLGAAVLTGAMGAYFGVKSRNNVNGARQATSTEAALSRLDNANSQAKLANVLFAGAGAAGIGAGLTYWLWRDEPAAQR